MLASCMRTSAYEVTTIVPFGAPSVCYYDQGNNENLYTAEPTAILPLFQNPNPLYDALIIDSRTGLLHSKRNNSPYKMAKLITAGNLYLVGLNGNNNAPTTNSVIYAFQENEIPGLVFKHLCQEYFHIGVNQVEWVDTANLISPIAREGKYHGRLIDYVLIPEPSLHAIKLSSKSAISNYCLSLRDVWHNITGQSAIPQAALFVNKNAYQQKKKQFITYFDSLNNRIANAINDVDKVKEELNRYGDHDAQVARFGFNADIITSIQKNNNGLALYSSIEEYNCDKMNEFLNKLGLENYQSEDFININD